MKTFIITLLSLIIIPFLFVVLTDQFTIYSGGRKHLQNEIREDLKDVLNDTILLTLLDEYIYDAKIANKRIDVSMTNVSFIVDLDPPFVSLVFSRPYDTYFELVEYYEAYPFAKLCEKYRYGIRYYDIERGVYHVEFTLKCIASEPSTAEYWAFYTLAIVLFSVIFLMVSAYMDRLRRRRYQVRPAEPQHEMIEMVAL